MKPDTHLFRRENSSERGVYDQAKPYLSLEFKHEAADLVPSQNYSVMQASRSLGISETALERWTDQLQQKSGTNRTEC
jgi:transposase-like protein